MENLMVLLWISLAIQNTCSSSINTTSGSTVTLICPQSSTGSVMWYGPPHFRPYSDNFEVSTDIKAYNRIQITGYIGQLNLVIKNVTYSDEGQYRCRVIHDIPLQYDMDLIIAKATTKQQRISTAIIRQSTEDTRYNNTLRSKTEHPGMYVKINHINEAVDEYMLECAASENRTNYEFVLWEHLSELRDHIRFIPSNKNGRLIILNTNSTYQNSGIYKCIANYKLPNDSRKILVETEARLDIKDAPVFIEINQAEQFTKVCEEPTITVYLYSYPKYYDISCNRDGHGKYLSESPSLFREELIETKVEFHGVTARVYGYKITFQDTSSEEFAVFNYSFIVRNELGQRSFNVVLSHAGCPLIKKYQVYFVVLGVVSALAFFIGALCAVYWRIHQRSSSNSRMSGSQENPTSDVINEYEEIGSILDEITDVTTRITTLNSEEEYHESPNDVRDTSLSNMTYIRDVHRTLSPDTINDTIFNHKTANNSIITLFLPFSDEGTIHKNGEISKRKSQTSESNDENSLEDEDPDDYLNPYDALLNVQDNDHEYAHM